MVLGIVVGLSTLGLDLTSLAVFAGAIGIGLGLGLQGIVKEFVSGLVLISDRALHIGDYIELPDGTRGVVQEIGPRSTRIRNNDNVYLLVPNSKLIENTMINWTLRGHTRRIHVPFQRRLRRRQGKGARRGAGGSARRAVHAARYADAEDASLDDGLRRFRA